ACIVADVHHTNSCLREGDHSLIGVDAVRRLRVAPRMPYLGPGDAFVVGTIESQVAGHDVLWIGPIHGEHREADAPIWVFTAVRPGRAIRWDLDPCRAAVDGLV